MPWGASLLSALATKGACSDKSLGKAAFTFTSVAIK
jgi:hypothetical protein